MCAHASSMGYTSGCATGSLNTWWVNFSAVMSVSYCLEGKHCFVDFCHQIFLQISQIVCYVMHSASLLHFVLSGAHCGNLIHLSIYGMMHCQGQSVSLQECVDEVGAQTIPNSEFIVVVTTLRLFGHEDEIGLRFPPSYTPE